jgi:hypothetical protein
MILNFINQKSAENIIKTANYNEPKRYEINWNLTKS